MREPIRWDQVFSTVQRKPPASNAALVQLVDDLQRAPSDDEVRTIIERQTNPFPRSDPHHAAYRPVDPTHWRLPAADLPESYLSFLRWSNGGFVQNGPMQFSFYGTAELREMMFAYHVPEYMPLAIPLGLDGSGNFALLDVRAAMVDGEYPLVVQAASNIGFDDAVVLAPTFEQFCRRTRRVEDALYEGQKFMPSAEALASAARRERARALAAADEAFRAKDFTRVIELLEPHRDSLEGSVQAKLRIAEKRRASSSGG